MTAARATYRLQFRNGMTFDAAAAIVPYLADLGISHLYASPIFTAAPGSTHGYDVANHQELAPELGGEDGFRRLAAELKRHDLGLLLDIVPNHMAVSTANPWWRDVLKHGRGSRFARHFDIDWTAPKLLLPVLGEPYGEALKDGKLALSVDETSNEVVFSYFDLALPLVPGSLKSVVGGGEDRTAAVAAVNSDQELLHRLHEAQVWRLAYWRLAREALTYRRFFEITDLIGVRVEDPAVFADVHKLPLQLVREGAVEQLRIDHVDGLADPKGYLEQLREASGLKGVLVEKILGPDEELRRDWPCAGTTGYELAGLITAMQVDPGQREAMTRGWTGFTEAESDFDQQVLSAKRRILTLNLAGELAGLVHLAQIVAGDDRSSRDFGPDTLRHAIVELAAALPVYRTYIDAEGASEEDRALIALAAERVEQGREVEDSRVIAFLTGLLLNPTDGSPARQSFIVRFQQTTGPLMAKAVEDTVFYRYNRLIALNEVGAQPDAFGLDPEAFHATMRRRAEAWPEALSATATHDTKRGEDARARLAVLSEMPQEWAATVWRWHEAAAPLREELASGPAPSRGAEWLFYQALVGAWPVGLSLQDEAGLQELAERLVNFMIKALREAKGRTSWTGQDEAYEGAVEGYVRGLFAPAHRRLLRDIRATITAIEPPGTVNSLAQLVLKMTLPGVPDTYQGCELPDFSMVDPDNRRPVDFELRQRLLSRVRALVATEVMAHWREGLPKLWLLQWLLALRTRHPELLSGGSYAPLQVQGDEAEHVIAFARSHESRTVVVAVPRLVFRHVDGGDRSWVSSAFSRTTLRLPKAGAFESLGGMRLEGSAELPLADLWSDLPVFVAETTVSP